MPPTDAELSQLEYPEDEPPHLMDILDNKSDNDEKSGDDDNIKADPLAALASAIQCQILGKVLWIDW